MWPTSRVFATADMSIGTEPNAIYALDAPKKLKPHVNKWVDIRGVVEVRTDKDKGQVAKTDGAMRIDAEGRRPTRIPEGTSAAAAAASGGVGSDRLTYKVKVTDVMENKGSTCTK